MPEDRSSAAQGGDQGEQSIWTGLRDLIFGRPAEDTLRDQLEDAIDRHEDDPAPDAKGDLTPLERQMVRNLLHFGERTVEHLVSAREHRDQFDHALAPPVRGAETRARLLGLRHGEGGAAGAEAEVRSDGHTGALALSRICVQ